MTPAQDDIPEHDGDDLLAAEYVLGALPADERRQAARRVDSDVEYARLVDGWERRLSPMADAYPEIEAPSALKHALDRRLFGQPAAHRSAGFWSNLAFWRGMALTAVTALVLAIAILVFMPPIGPRTGERLVASLSAQETKVHYFVVYDGATSEIGLSHVSGDREAGHDFELWVIDGNQPPVSLGVIPVGSNVHLAVADALKRKIESGAMFAISMEPAGGSPTGKPTGPVVAAGDLKDI